MTAVHQLTSGLFDRLAAGDGGPGAVRELRAAQLSRHLLLIRYLLGQWCEPDARAVGELLERSRNAEPQRFAEVVGAPLVGGWSAIVGRAAAQGRVAPADFAHLAAIALVACAAAKVDGRARIPVHSGLAMLPGLGAVEAGDATSVEATTADGRIVIMVGAATLEVPADPSRAMPGWQPIRQLTSVAAGQRLGVGLDDLNPYRHGHHVPPAPRLSAAEIDLWQERFAAAWALLAEHLPGRAGELAESLRTLVPLTPDPHSARSATIRHAYGVFGLTLPRSPADFAVTLVHEFQHSKLSALLDLVPLTRAGDTGRYFAPWRLDPRPLTGLLQGVYAFAGVADTWRALRGAVPEAESRFAEARLQVDRGLAAVESSAALTPEGAAFATALRRTTDRLLAEPVSPQVATAAAETLARTMRAWEERNGR